MKDKLGAVFVALAIVSLGAFAGEWIQDFVVLNSSAEHPIELTGDATVWDDLRAPATTAVGLPGRVPAQVTWKTHFIVLDFDYQANVNNEKAATFELQTPHSRKSFTDLDAHVHWTPGNSTVCNMRLCIYHSCAAIGGTFPAATVGCVTVANGTQDEHIRTDILDIDGSSLGISSSCSVTFRRASSDIADTCLATSLYFKELDLHFEKDSLGSREEDSK